MSLLSQFYPQGGVTSGYIRVEVFMVAGGGGGAGGGPYPYTPTGDYGTGEGGAGGVFVGYINLSPGKTTPITVGAGGAGGVSTPQATVGGNGSASSINTEVESLQVYGGGGGGIQNAPGAPGGSGGGGYGLGPTTQPGGFSSYATFQGTRWQTGFPGGSYGESNLSSAAGAFFGCPGDGGTPTQRGAGGSALGSLGYVSSITGTTFMYATGGNITNPYKPYPTPSANTGIGGDGGSWRSTPAANAVGFPGGSGVVVIKYPTQFGAASSFPGASDVSPATPGYRTYKFTSSGSITLP